MTTAAIIGVGLVVCAVVLLLVHVRGSTEMADAKAATAATQEAIGNLRNLFVAESTFHEELNRFSTEAAPMGFSPDHCKDGSTPPAPGPGWVVGCYFAYRAEVTGEGEAAFATGQALGLADAVKGKRWSVTTKRDDPRRGIPHEDEATPAATEVLVAGPRSLWDAYQQNEVGADNRFRGKRIRIAGVVHAMKKDALNNIVVEIAATPIEPPSESDPLGDRLSRHALFGGVISCRFDDEWAKRVGELEREKLVGIECTGRGMVNGTPQLGECAVTWSQPRDLGNFAEVLGPSYELCRIEAAVPAMKQALEAGALSDGGPLPPDGKKRLAKVESILDEDRVALTQLGADPLPCSHPAILIFGGCDGESKNSAPQCSSELVNLTFEHIHRN